MLTVTKTQQTQLNAPTTVKTPPLKVATKSPLEVIADVSESSASSSSTSTTSSTSITKSASGVGGGATSQTLVPSKSNAPLLHQTIDEETDDRVESPSCEIQTSEEQKSLLDHSK